MQKPPTPYAPPKPPTPPLVMTEKQQHIFDQLKEHIQSDAELSPEQKAWCDDACLKRYLRARDFDLKASEKMLRETLRWRKEHRPEAIQYSEVAKVLDVKTVYPNGHDREGRPVIYCRIGAANPFSPAERFRALIYTIEHEIAQMKPGVEKMVWVLDFGSYSWRKSTPESQQVSKQSMTLLQDHYPERLATSLMVNPPWYFAFLFKVVSPFMSAATLAKVRVLGHGEELRKQLLDFISEDELDSCYGGNRVADFSLPKAHANPESSPPPGAAFDDAPLGCPPADQHFVSPAPLGFSLSLDPPGEEKGQPPSGGTCMGSQTPLFATVTTTSPATTSSSTTTTTSTPSPQPSSGSIPPPDAPLSPSSEAQLKMQKLGVD